MLCTCRQKFRVMQVGEGKYRVSGSDQFRLFLLCLKIYDFHTMVMVQEYWLDAKRLGRLVSNQYSWTIENFSTKMQEDSFDVNFTETEE